MIKGDLNGASTATGTRLVTNYMYVHRSIMSHGESKKKNMQINTS